MTRRICATLIVFALCVGVVAWGLGALRAGARPQPAQTSLTVKPIKHVLTGPLCLSVRHKRCHGVHIGKNHHGSAQPLTAAAHPIPGVGHAAASQNSRNPRRGQGLRLHLRMRAKLLRL